MAKIQHIHKLKRLRYKTGNTIFFCCLPDCSFKTNVALALGKRSLCWRCGKDFILSEYALRLAKPHCEDCHRPKGMEGFPLTKEDIDNGSIIMPNFPPNRELKQGEIPQLTLAERLQQTLKQAHKPIEQEEEL